MKFFQNIKLAKILFLLNVLIISEIKVNKLPPFTDTQRTVLTISKALPRTPSKDSFGVSLWWWRWITNPHQQSFLYFKSVKYFVSLVSQNTEGGCARRCVVKNHTPHSGTRHLNWNVKVWQYPMPYPFKNSVVTQLCQGTCYSLADRVSKQDLDSVPSGKKRAKSTETFLTFDNAFSRYYRYRKGLWELQL